MPSTTISSTKPEVVKSGDILFLPGNGIVGDDSIIHRFLKNGERPFGHSVVVSAVYGVYSEILIVTSWGSDSASAQTLTDKWRPRKCRMGYCHFKHSDRSQRWSEHPGGYKPLECTSGSQFRRPGSYLNMRTPYLIESAHLLYDHGPMRGSRLTQSSLEFVTKTFPRVQDAWCEPWEKIVERAIGQASLPSTSWWSWSSDSSASPPWSSSSEALSWSSSEALSWSSSEALSWSSSSTITPASTASSSFLSLESPSLAPSQPSQPASPSWSEQEWPSWQA